MTRRYIKKSKMIIEILLMMFTTIVVYYLYSHKRLQRHFEERGVKFVPGWPLFGNVIGSTLQRKHISEDLDAVYEQFPGERYVGFLDMTRPMIIIRDPELIKNIVVKDFDHFTDHKEFFSEDLDPLFAGSLFLMKGERWRQMRTTLSPAFTSLKMKNILPSITEISGNIVEYINDHEGEDIDVDDLIHRYANDVIATAGFGCRVNSLKDRNNDFFKTGEGIFEFNFKQRLNIIIMEQFPELGKKLGLRLFSENVYSFFSKVVASTMEQRKRENIERPDMIQLLMEAKTDWTPEELAGQVFIFYLAGLETSSGVMLFSIHELALNPDIQEKLYQECKNFSETNELTFENVTELKYLDAVLNESFRRWCPAIFLDRTCTKTYELPPPREGGKPYVLKPGDLVYNLVNQVAMDPKYWSDPQKFDPDRFSDENKDKITPFTFMPFGIGPRVCIGMRFAILELKVLMYHLILSFKIVRTARTVEPIKLHPSLISNKVAGGTNVQFRRRLSK